MGRRQESRKGSGFGFRVSGFGPLAGEFSRGDRYPFGSDDLMDMLSS